MINNIAAVSSLVDEDLKKELTGIFEKLNADVVLKTVADESTDKGKEVLGFLAAIASLSSHITLEAYSLDEAEKVPELNTTYLPVTGLYKNGEYSGVAFHGVPGGKEINSFVLAIYNLAGPGQEISRWTLRKIQKINKKVNIKICVSLACHHCPKVVVACQRMALLNENIEAEMIDANLYKELIDQYRIERVPVIIINDEEILTGPRTIEEMTDTVKKITK